MWAIIGGSGFEKFDDVKKVQDVMRETPFGQASSGLKKIQLGNRECLFLPRHGEHHELSPSEVNYRANIFALKQAGAKVILSVSAVGSLQPDLKPGHLVVAEQYIDRTKGIRPASFCGGGIVGHVSLAKPVANELVMMAKKIKADFPVHYAKTYVCIEGPYFSTQAESTTYRQAGADIIGMTNFPEFALAREAGLGYLPLCFVTDFDCWDDNIPHVTLPEVIKIMKDNNKKAHQWISDFFAVNGESLADLNFSDLGLKTGLMTPKENIPPAKMEWLQTLIS